MNEARVCIYREKIGGTNFELSPSSTFLGIAHVFFQMNKFSLSLRIEAQTIKTTRLPHQANNMGGINDIFISTRQL